MGDLWLLCQSPSLDSRFPQRDTQTGLPRAHRFIDEASSLTAELDPSILDRTWFAYPFWFVSRALVFHSQVLSQNDCLNDIVNARS